MEKNENIFIRDQRENPFRWDFEESHTISHIIQKAFIYIST